MRFRKCKKDRYHKLLRTTARFSCISVSQFRVISNKREELRMRRKRNNNLYVAAVGTDNKSAGVSVEILGSRPKRASSADESYPGRLGCPLFLDNYILLSQEFSK